MIPLIGYSDRLSGRPGDTISFKVSSISAEPFEAELFRSISADPNPAGPGVIERPVASSISGSYPSRVQEFYPGSYAIANGDLPSTYSDFRLSATIWPTLPLKGEQAILSVGDITLMLDENGNVTAQAGQHRIATSAPLETRVWYRVWLTYDGATLAVGQEPDDIAVLPDLSGFEEWTAGLVEVRRHRTNLHPFPGGKIPGVREEHLPPRERLRVGRGQGWGQAIDPQQPREGSADRCLAAVRSQLHPIFPVLPGFDREIDASLAAYKRGAARPFRNAAGMALSDSDDRLDALGTILPDHNMKLGRLLVAVDRQAKLRLNHAAQLSPNLADGIVGVQLDLPDHDARFGPSIGIGSPARIVGPQDCHTEPHHLDRVDFEGRNELLVVGGA